MKSTNLTSKTVCTFTSRQLIKVATGMFIGATILLQQACTTVPSNHPESMVSPVSANTIQRQVNAFVVKQEGIERLVPITAATQLSKGDLIEYQGKFTNTSSKRVESMVVTMTIPEEVVLMGETVPEFPLASIDGHNFLPVPLTMNVNGELTNIPLAQYRALRFDVGGIGVNETATAIYRAVVK